MHVECYLNLHKSKPGAPVLSIRHKGIVIGHARAVRIWDATFPVQPAGRRRVLETGVKNVHAFVRGDLDLVYFWPGSDPLLEEGDADAWRQRGIEVARLSNPTDDYGHYFTTDEMAQADFEPVTYNPRKYSSFVLRNDPTFPVRDATVAIVDGGAVWIRDEWPAGNHVRHYMKDGGWR